MAQSTGQVALVQAINKHWDGILTPLILNLDTGAGFRPRQLYLWETSTGWLKSSGCVGVFRKRIFPFPPGIKMT